MKSRFFSKKGEDASYMDLCASFASLSPFFFVEQPLYPVKGEGLGKRHALPVVEECQDLPLLYPLQLGWHEEGLTFAVVVPRKSSKKQKQEPLSSLQLELFVATREHKELFYMTKFCHHFLFRFEASEGWECKEVTKFRGEETRPLALPTVFEVAMREAGGNLVIEVDVPQVALYGYDPLEVRTLGWTCRLSGEALEEQVYCSPQEFPPEQFPSYWPSFTLVADA